MVLVRHSWYVIPCSQDGKGLQLEDGLPSTSSAASLTKSFNRLWEEVYHRILGFMAPFVLFLAKENCLQGMKHGRCHEAQNPVM